MKNLLIRYITIISLVSLFTIAWSNTLTLNDKELATKLQIETNLSEKVSNVISKVYPVNQFAVTTNISLLSVNQNSNTTQAVQSFGALELEGILPAVPSTNNTGGPAMNNNDYRVQIKDITIWLDSDLNVINAQNEIKPYIFDAMDWLAGCQNCIQFKSMQFPNTGSTENGEKEATTSGIDTEDLKIIEENIEYILNQLDQLTESGESEGMSKNEWMIDYLTRALDEQKIENKGLKTEVLVTYKNVLQADSLLKMTSIENVKEIALTAMETNKEFASQANTTQQETIKNHDNNTTKTVEVVAENLEGDDTILWVVLGLLMLLLIVLVILDRRGPKTVYLKPKQNKDANQAEKTADTGSTTTPAPTTTQTTETFDATSAYADDSVVQSDLKSMKQSAVKMSVGQKQGASQIVQDWLDDGGDNNDSSKEQTNE